jgi:transcriptional regulator with XRE-family HTH domain
VTVATQARSREHAGLGLAVRELRQARQFSLRGLAQATGLHFTYIAGVEQGWRNPSYRVIVVLSRALDVRPGELVTRADELAEG